MLENRAHRNFVFNIRVLSADEIGPKSFATAVYLWEEYWAPKMKRARSMTLCWTVSTRIGLFAILRSQIKEPYFEMSLTRARLYRVTRNKFCCQHRTPYSVSYRLGSEDLSSLRVRDQRHNCLLVEVLIPSDSKHT